MKKYHCLNTASAVEIGFVVFKKNNGQIHSSQYRFRSRNRILVIVGSVILTIVSIPLPQ